MRVTSEPKGPRGGTLKFSDRLPVFDDRDEGE